MLTSNCCRRTLVMSSPYRLVFTIPCSFSSSAYPCQRYRQCQTTRIQYNRWEIRYKNLPPIQYDMVFLPHALRACTAPEMTDGTLESPSPRLNSKKRIARPSRRQETVPLTQNKAKADPIHGIPVCRLTELPPPQAFRWRDLDSWTNVDALT